MFEKRDQIKSITIGLNEYQNSTRKEDYLQELDKQCDCLTAAVGSLLISLPCCYLLVFAVDLKLQDPLIV